MLRELTCLQQIVKSSDDAIITETMNGKIASWSPGAQKIYGYAPDEVIGKNISILVPPEIENDIDPILEKLKRGERVDHYNTVRMRKDQSRINVSLTVSPIRDSDGNVVGASTIARDITEAIKDKQRLEESEEKYRQLVENAPIGISILRGGIIVLCNSKELELFGLEKNSDLVGHSISEFISKQHLAEYSKLSQEVMQSKTVSPMTQFEPTRTNGSKFCIESQLFSSSYKGEACIVVFHRDITEHQRKEKELQESEHKYKRILEGSNDGVIEVDSSTRRIVFANPAICRLTGYTEKELLTLRVEDMHPKEALPFVIEQLEKLARGEIPLAEAIPVLKKDKNMIYCHINGSTLEIENRSLVVAFFRDVTESRGAEEAIIKLGEKYRALVENIDDIVFTIDVNGVTTYVSPSGERLTGFKRDELVGKPFLNFFKPTEEGNARSNFARMLSGEAVKGVEAAIPGRDGTLVYYEANMYPLFSNGHIVGIQGVARDVTERKHWNDELSASEERLNILFERAPDGYYLSDLRGNFIDGNKAAEEITGFSKSELIGKSFLKLGLLPRSQIPKAAKLLALNIVGKPTGPDELTLNRKDGSQVPVEIRTFPTEIQGRKLVLGIARDITQRKNAENLILESQQRFAALFSNNPEATVYTDPSMHILDINPRFTSLFGYSLDKIKGKNLNDVLVPASLIEEAKTLDSKTERGCIYHDTVRKRKDGSMIPVSISASPISIQGQPAGIIGVYKDISEQTSSRKKLVMLNEKLQVVGGLTRHDVRNKLTAIVGNTYLIKKEMPGNEKVQDRLEEIEKAVQQSVKIFDFAKTYEMLGAEEMAYVDVGKTVKDATSLFTDLKGTKVINECRGLDVFADSLLQQLFYNLIDNSLKYGQKMTTIRVHHEQNSKNHLELVYEDDGVGIPIAGKTKLFTEGYSTGGSTGYGLYLIKKMAEVYGWTLKETGEPGKGARFLMTIPKTNENGKINYKLH